MVENNTTNRISMAHKEAILMAMSARPGENLKKKKKKKNSRSSKFLLLKEVRRVRMPLDNNTEH